MYFSLCISTLLQRWVERANIFIFNNCCPKFAKLEVNGFVGRGGVGRATNSHFKRLASFTANGLESVMMGRA